MCNLYSQTKGQQSIRDAARAMLDRLGNLPPLPAIFPDCMAPIVRGNGGDREMIMARWGFPPPPPHLGAKPSTRPVTNVRNTDSRHWTPWLKKPEHRCLVPVTSFSEPDNRAGIDKPSIWTWFARDESRPVMFFAGIWREWEGTRGTKRFPLQGNHLLYSFLTTDASPDVAPIHPDATPVLLLTQDEQEAWLNAPWEIARDLQRPPPAGTLRIVAAGEKQDAA
jgi:putative SOS response-associated peptidase YedK